MVFETLRKDDFIRIILRALYSYKVRILLPID